MPPHVPPIPPIPPGRPAASDPAHDAVQLRHIGSLREATQRAQRAFLVVNAVPFVGGIALSSFTDVPALRVRGELTLGVIWGILQCGLFVVTAWLYESRSARSCDPLERSLTSGEFQAGTPGAARATGPGW